MFKINLKSITLFSLFLIFSQSNTLQAKAFRVGQLPNGSVNGCANCHVSSGGGGTRTTFGNQVMNGFLVSSNVNWGPALATMDADGDGFTNGHELEDPFGLWTSAVANPGTPGFVSNPGDPNSTPAGDAEKFSVHASFSGMGSYTNEYFELKVIDADNGALLHQETVSSIASADFEFVLMHLLTSEGNYNLDFWVDVNRNNSYDAPPTDHAWRVQLNGIIDNVPSSFTSNTNYTDIGGTVAVDDVVELPTIAQLYTNYPNPFNPSTTIRVDLNQDQFVSLDIYNVRGEHVSNLISGDQLAGQYSLHWDATDSFGEVLPAGVYIYTLRTTESVSSKRMMLLK